MACNTDVFPLPLAPIKQVKLASGGVPTGGSEKPSSDLKLSIWILRIMIQYACLKAILHPSARLGL
jgi:hypothetical protein